jgi:hypothetical protein
VEWASQEALDNVRQAVQKLHAEMKFNPQETMARLGIKADIANYTRLEA